jgi:hypothetical protein
MGIGGRVGVRVRVMGGRENLIEGVGGVGLIWINKGSLATGL